MDPIYISSDNIITSLGYTTIKNCEQLCNGIIGIRKIEDQTISSTQLYASIINSEELEFIFSQNNHSNIQFTRLEKLAIISITDALQQTNIDASSTDTIFILSTTKGNIDLVNNNASYKFEKNRLYLWESAYIIKEYFKSPNKPIVVSNACVSGIMAIIMASRMIRSGKFKNAIVTGVDILSDFVVAGFQSFQAISSNPCRPFDKSRDGLSLGEGCGTIVLSSNENSISNTAPMLVGGGSSGNDANHISGPSRTGDGLYLAIKKVLACSLTELAAIDYISSHGTATPYNDEMESIALSRANLSQVPVNSFKGYWGHTLGAAGIIESIAGIYSMKNNILIRSAGFSELGVSKDLNIINHTEKKEISNCLKIASGFGGCNAAVIFYKG